jgi:hypothetical protein
VRDISGAHIPGAGPGWALPAETAISAFFRDFSKTLILVENLWMVIIPTIVSRVKP